MAQSGWSDSLPSALWIAEDWTKPLWFPVLAAGSVPVTSLLACVFSSAQDSPIASYWVKKAFWAKAESPFQALDAGTYPHASTGACQSATVPGLHIRMVLLSNGEGFYWMHSEGKRQTKRVCAHACAERKGGKGAKGNLAWGCLFMRTLNNSFLSLLSSSQRDKNKRVFLAYCLERRIVKREENITVTEGDTRKSVTFNCSTYNQSHQIKALYIFLNNLWLGSGYERTRTPAIAMQQEAC